MPIEQLPAAGGRQDVEELLADRTPQPAQLLRGGRVVLEELAGHPHRPEGRAARGEDLAAPHAAELEAAPSEVRDGAIGDGQTAQGGQRPQARLLRAR